MFRDEAFVEVVAGKGGDGLVSFRREKYVPNGGPDGGDGGDGGSVIFVARSDVHSLLEVGRRFRFTAGKGQPGGPRLCSGRGGKDTTVHVPVGTLVHDKERGNLLRDLDHEGMELVVAQGGHGGRGNPHFATSVRQAPRMATSGQQGEHRHLRLELKIFAEVGLLGLPNAGKSTFLSRVTAATPKIADYPFTTLVPQVGIAEVGNHDTLVIADLPGLIEGAAEGQGLGHQFLKHVERCKVLLHMVDVSDGALSDPVDAFRTLEKELAAFSSDLYAKPRIVVASKHFEDASSEARVAALRQATDMEVFGLSSVLGSGLPELLLRAQRLVRE